MNNVYELSVKDIYDTSFIQASLIHVSLKKKPPFLPIVPTSGPWTDFTVG